jgi:putative oxidoreductase
MDRLYSRFPGGVVGVGLLLLRLSVASWYIASGVPMLGVSPAASFLALLLLGIALLLIAGLRTSVNAGLGSVCSVVLLPASGRDHGLSALLLAFLSISLALLGPGGYSLDARLSGWRTIHLSSPPQSQRPGD